MSLPMKRLRSSTKRVFRRTPTGKVVMHAKKPTRDWVKCRICGAILGGVNDSRKMSKSKKLPTRIFAGQLCSGCVADVVKARVRIRTGDSKPEDYPFVLRGFISAKQVKQG